MKMFLLGFISAFVSSAIVLVIWVWRDIRQERKDFDERRLTRHAPREYYPSTRV